jgi:sec-independent protein translocase protein TatB
MFGIGFSELVIIVIVAVVFIGPNKLPEVMKQLGRFFVHARRMSNDVRSTFETVIQQAEKEIHLENLEKIKQLTKDTLAQANIDPNPPAPPTPNDSHQHHDSHQHGPDEMKQVGPQPATPAQAPAVAGTESTGLPSSHSGQVGTTPDFDNHSKS